jgi:flagellar export protein FliJ
MAKRFRFRLEAVLKVRQQKLDACRRVVGRRQRRMQGIRDRIRGHQDEAKRTMAQMRVSLGEARTDILWLRRARLYIGTMQELAASAEAELGREAVLLRQEQQELLEANRQVKALEKLRQRQWERHQRIQQRAERFDADETALQLYRRGLAQPYPTRS